MKPAPFFSITPAGNRIAPSALLAVIKTRSQSFLPAVSEYLGTSDLLYLSSGRAALWVILKALARMNPTRKKVIVPAYTCPAVVSAVLKARLVPVLVDISLNDFGFDLADLAQNMESDVLAVVVVHLLGYPAEMMKVGTLCRDNGSFLIEDAAQGFGNTFVDDPEKKLGLLGDVGFFSFGRGKPLTVLHGGLVATSSTAIFEEARNVYEQLPETPDTRSLGVLLSLVAYRCFSNPYLYWLPQNARFLHIGETIFEHDFGVLKGSNCMARVLGRVIHDLEREKEIRHYNSRWYCEHLGGRAFAGGPVEKGYPFLRYPFIVKDRRVRDTLLRDLKSAGTGASLLYPCPLNRLPVLRDVLEDDRPYPNSQMLSETLITLPVHSGVNNAVRERIESIVCREASPCKN